MDVLMPQLGETVAEGKITKWFKSAGEQVKPGDNLFEIETDKVSMEVPSTTTGVLSEIRVGAGDVAPVGAGMSGPNDPIIRWPCNSGTEPLSISLRKIPLTTAWAWATGTPGFNLPLTERLRTSRRSKGLVDTPLCEPPSSRDHILSGA